MKRLFPGASKSHLSLAEGLRNFLTMKLLDRYLLRRFVTILLFAMIAFLTIFLIVDLVENIDKFIDAGLTRSQVLTYYLLNIPFFLSIGLPMSMLIAAVFSMGILSRDNEITAMKSSGVSLYRIVAPLLIFATLVSVGSFFFDDQVTVHTNRQLENYKERYIQGRPPQQKLQRQDLFIQDTPRRNLIIDYFNGKNLVGRRATIQYLSAGRMERRIDGNRIFWEDSLDSWMMVDYVIREFPDTSTREIVSASPGTLQVSLSVSPDELMKEAIDPAQMDYAELRDFIARLESLGISPRKWRVNLHYKVAFAFTNFVVVLFGLPLTVLQKRGGLAAGAGISIFVIFAYYALIKVGQVMGFKGVLPPLLSVWIGNIVFIAGGVILLMRTPK